MSLLARFYEELTNHLSRGSPEDCRNAQKLVRFHETGDYYDFSFPVALRVWKNYLTKITEEDIERYSDDILSYSAGASDEISGELLRRESSGWTFIVTVVDIKDRHYNLAIDRPSCFTRLIDQVSFNSDYGKSEKIQDETISIEADNDESGSVTQLRVDLVSSVVNNLLAYSKFPESSSSTAKHKVLVTSKSMLSRNHGQSDRQLLVVGPAVSPVDKKTSATSAHEYITKRCQDMHLTSVHKFGVRVDNNERFLNLIQRLGRNAAMLDLLEVKHPSSVPLNPNTNQAFILYNSARLETLVDKFEKKVEEGYYQQLPDIKQIDSSLLIEHEEWQLAKLLLTFPQLIDRSTNELPQGRVSIHLLHKYLQDLVNVFSIYYRRVRLLTENRSQLMSVLHVKIHFLRAFRTVFNQTLAIFSIEPIAFM